MSAVYSTRDQSAPRDDEVARLRVPPHSIEAEQSVLGGLLLDNSAWDRAGDLLTDTDFYRYEHKAILELRHVPHGHRQVEFLPVRHTAGDDPHHDSVRAPLHKDVHAKAAQAGNAVGNIRRSLPA